MPNNQLLIGGLSTGSLVRRFGTPLFVYDENIIRQRARTLRQAVTYPNTRLLYSCKSNTNPAIMKILRNEGFGIDAVSPGEIYFALRIGFKPSEISFTGNNCRTDELAYVVKQGVLVNADSLSQLERVGKIKPGLAVSLRINPDVGDGHHEHVITGGPDSKFGIWVYQLDQALKIAAKYRLKIVGLHHHIGSGILEAETFITAMEIMLKIAMKFSAKGGPASGGKVLEFINMGGGLGVAYSPGQKQLDIRKFGRMVSERFSAFCRHYGKPLQLMLEPGRYPVCEAGTLLTTVTDIKETPEHTFVGTDSGFNHLIRHAFYNAYHEIVNASRLKGPKQFVAVCGNICESGDMFTHGREITKFREGDIAAIKNAGAYGYSMAMQYNMRPKPAEVMVKGNKARLIRRRESFNDLPGIK
ncbi:MAG TPA: diaminopimelate decarboxylase [Planctomycetota bacterium]|nr:diaminopimelate decarboxylase [Planctomycetota bacterium]